MEEASSPLLLFILQDLKVESDSPVDQMQRIIHFQQARQKGKVGFHCGRAQIAVLSKQPHFVTDGEIHSSDRLIGKAAVPFRSYRNVRRLKRHLRRRIAYAPAYLGTRPVYRIETIIGR